MVFQTVVSRKQAFGFLPIGKKGSISSSKITPSALLMLLTFCLTVIGLNLDGIRIRYGSVFRILKEKECSLAKAMKLYGVARKPYETSLHYAN